MNNEEIIQKYETIKEKWDNSDMLKIILPKKYVDICKKLEYLKQGENFKIIDKTEDLKAMIAYVGGKIPTLNIRCDNNKFINKKDIEYKEAKKIAENFGII